MRDCRWFCDCVLEVDVDDDAKAEAAEEEGGCLRRDEVVFMFVFIVLDAYEVEG